MSQFFSDLFRYFGQAQLLLTALSATGLVKPESATQISAVLGDLEGVAKNANPPTPELAASVASLLNDLSADGLIQGAAVAQISAGLSKFTALVHDVQANQSIILDDKASFAGVEGIVMFSPLSSDQAKSVGY